MATTIDSALMFTPPDKGHIWSTLSDIGQLFQVDIAEAFREYKIQRGFSELHNVLLGIDDQSRTLEEYMARQDPASLAGLIDNMDFFGRTPLAWAVESGRPDAVRTLLWYGANPHQTRKSSTTTSSFPLLHLAIAGPILNPQFLDVVQALLDWGADINGKDNEGWTPLHIAVSWSLYAVMPLLIRCSDLDWFAMTEKGEFPWTIPAEREFRQTFHLTQEENPSA